MFLGLMDGFATFVIARHGLGLGCTKNILLKYLITVQYLLKVHNGKLDFIWLAKKDNLMLLN